MLPDTTNQLLPMCGVDHAKKLGVRVYIGREPPPKHMRDLDVLEDGHVLPESGGMSTCCDSIDDLPTHSRPFELGGNNPKAKVFSIPMSALPPGLKTRKDRDDHSHTLVEPSERCLYKSYEACLHGTQQDWRLVG